MLCNYSTSNHGLTNATVLGINPRIRNEETNNAVIDHVADMIKVFTSKGLARIVFVSIGFGSFQYKFLGYDLMMSR
ncbi:MAG: hypothetical protein ACP5IE_00830 [Infirmifilum sp.]